MRVQVPPPFPFPADKEPNKELTVPLTDSNALRELAAAFVPGVAIEEVASASGQRVVYFCNYQPAEKPATETDEEEESAEGDEDLDTLEALNDFLAIPAGEVVLKISADIDAASLSYLEREIGFLASIDSTAFPTLYFARIFHEHPETGETLPIRYLVTIEEKIPSRPLSECLKEFDTEAKVIDFMADVVEAMEVLWGKGLVHRDLKPPNILIRDDGGVAIIDLGIVRLEGEKGKTATFSPWGPCTPGYCSPEQATNDKANITHKSDQFCIGIIAYEMLSGSNPFVTGKKSIDDKLVAVTNEDLPNLEETFGISNDLSQLIHRMLEKQPFRRVRRRNDLRDSIATLRKELK
ncbi:MAG TPA: protein kinase [Gammaproteobacteria bacterium]